MKLDTRQRKIVRNIAIKYGLEIEQAEEIIESPFKFIRKTITKVDLQAIETEEEFITQFKNFNIPYIGKMYANIYNFKKFKKRKNESRQSK